MARRPSPICTMIYAMHSNSVRFAKCMACSVLTRQHEGKAFNFSFLFCRLVMSRPRYGFSAVETQSAPRHKVISRPTERRSSQTLQSVGSVTLLYGVPFLAINLGWTLL